MAANEVLQPKVNEQREQMIECMQKSIDAADAAQCPPDILQSLRHQMEAIRECPRNDDIDVAQDPLEPWSEPKQRDDGKWDLTAITEIDMENAYGRALRAPSLKQTAADVPKLAHMAANQWQVSTKAWVQIKGVWVCFYADRGGWQGSTLMNAEFCFGLKAAVV